MNKDDFGRLIEILSQDDLSLGGRIFQARFELEGFDRLFRQFPIGRDRTLLGPDNYVCGIDYKGSVVYFSRYEEGNASDAFIEACGAVNSSYSQSSSHHY